MTTRKKAHDWLKTLKEALDSGRCQARKAWRKDIQALEKSIQYADTLSIATMSPGFWDGYFEAGWRIFYE
jgi:hypothetical protein